MTFTDFVILTAVVVIIGLIIYFSFIKGRGEHCKGCSYKKSCKNKKDGNCGK